VKKIRGEKKKKAEAVSLLYAQEYQRALAIKSISRFLFLVDSRDFPLQAS